MAARIRFVWNNVAGDTSSLTATSEAGTLVVENLQSDERDAVWRSSTLELAAAPTVNAAGTGYVPADTITLLVTGSTSTVKGVVTVATTKVVSATVAAAGTGGTPGPAVVTGTTGTGTPFTANVTIGGGGGITSVDSIASGGSYTVNPTDIANEPVTGGGLTGAQLNVVMGVNTITLTTPGTYTVGGTAATQDSTSGSGTGATFSGVTFSVSAQTIDFRWSTAQSVDSICLAWTNLSSAATVQAIGYTDEAGDSGQVFDETVSPDTGLTIGNVTVQNWIAAAFDIKHLKLVITDAANSDNYVQASRACIGARMSPAVNVDYAGLEIGWREQSKPVRAESRDLRVEALGRFRYLKLQLSWLEAASLAAIIAMVNNGLGRGVWVSVFSEDSSAVTRQLYAFWGALVQEVGYGYPLLNTWSAPLVFEEMG